ncbi:hypothetical protein DTW90_35840 [Neorhizobium sp. P12A]|nr:hypothetical protein DTW90_35840 [Neorhizobium sp. P12A]
MRRFVLVLLALFVPTFYCFSTMPSLVGSLLAHPINQAVLTDVLTHCQLTNVFEAGNAADTTRLLCPSAYQESDFSDNLYKAVVASEDHSFFVHDGYNIWSMVRGAGQSGASTITQQVVRMLLLTNREPTSQATKGRKLREWYYAREIEKIAGKRQIATIYLNIAYVGGGRFGFEQGARLFFSKSAKNLDFMEAAMLVAMLPSPANRNPVDYPQDSFKATVKVINQAVGMNFISRAEATRSIEEAKKRILGGTILLNPDSSEQVEYRRFRDRALDELAAEHVHVPARYRILLTLSPEMQAAADEIAIRPGYQLAGAFLNKNAEILAMAGQPYVDASWNSVWLSNRSIGSVGKTLVIGAGLKKGVSFQGAFSNEPIPAGYSPDETDPRCFPRMSLSTAFKYSCNRAFVRFASAVGPSVRALATKLGFHAPDNYLLASTGGISGNALSLAALMGTISDGGKQVQAHATLAVLTPKGEVTWQYRPGKRPAIFSNAQAATLRTFLALPTTGDGTGAAARGQLRSAAVYGKTGTSNDNEDALFAGFTNNWTGSVIYTRDSRTRLRNRLSGFQAAESFGSVVDAYWADRNRAAVGATVSRGPFAEGRLWYQIKLDDFFVVYGIPAGAALAVDMCLLFGATRSIRRFWPRNEVGPDELTATVTADAA